MDKEFNSELDTLFSERHSSIVALLKKENPNHKILWDRIKALKETVRTTISGEIRQSVDELLELLVLQNHIETKYLYFYPRSMLFFGSSAKRRIQEIAGMI